MMRANFTAAQMNEIKRLCRDHHNIRIKVQLLTLEHDYVEDFTDIFIDGTVNYDATTIISRSLDLTLFDPDNRIHIDPNSPSRTGIFIKYMIRINYVIIDPVSKVDYTIPVFCGPIDKVNRESVFLKVKALSKEKLSLRTQRRAVQYAKNSKKTDIIYTILTTLCGEAPNKIEVPSLTPRIGSKPFKISAGEKPFEVARKLAAGMGYQLRYDGRGVVRMFRLSKTVQFTFTDNHLVNSPALAYDLSNVYNAVDVQGKKVKNKDRPQARAIASGHPLSPTALGRNGVGLYLWKNIVDNDLRTNAQCLQRAKDELEAGLLAGIDVKWDGVPIPMLEEMDLVRLDSTEVTAQFRMSQWALPLNAGASTSYGYFKRFVPKRGRKAGRSSRS